MDPFSHRENSEFGKAIQDSLTENSGHYLWANLPRNSRFPLSFVAPVNSDNREVITLVTTLQWSTPLKSAACAQTQSAKQCTKLSTSTLRRSPWEARFGGRFGFCTSSRPLAALSSSQKKKNDRDWSVLFLHLNGGVQISGANIVCAKRNTISTFPARLKCRNCFVQLQTRLQGFNSSSSTIKCQCSKWKR